jgi:TrmH family RNA methyltransferase
VSETELIRSRTNPLVRRLRALKQRGERGEEALALLEGARLLEEALASGVQVVEVAITPRALGGARGRRLLQQLEATGTPVRLLHEDLLDSISEAETCQGVLALARRPRFVEAQLFAGAPLLMVALGVQNPGNLGGLLRTAEAAGASGAFLTRGCADPFSWKALRGSMGSAFRLPHLAGLSPEQVMRRLRARGVRTVAAMPAAPTSYDEADLRGPIAFLLGSEAAGVPESLTRGADLCLGIPLAGEVESLNVGVAAGLLLFEAARQRRQPPVPDSG